MKYEFTNGDNTYSWTLPPVFDDATMSYINDWAERIKKAEAEPEDVWTVIPAFPNYRFKNLQLVHEPMMETEEEVQLTITLKYDEVEMDNTIE